MNPKHVLRSAAHWPPLRPLAKPLHGSLVAAQLGTERWLDRRHPAALLPPGECPIDGELSILIKTFERPRLLRRLVGSIRRLYPTLPIIVVDDSRQPSPLDGVDTVVLPYNSGISAGRNAGLERVDSEYVLLLDDDFILYRHSRVEDLLGKMQRNNAFDIVGGEVIYLPFYGRFDYLGPSIYPTTAQPLLPLGSSIDGIRVQDKVANFFIARSAALRRVGWDPQLKMLEHADFFTRARGVISTGFDPGFKVLHARAPFDRNYMQTRTDLAPYQALLKERYNLD